MRGVSELRATGCGMCCIGPEVPRAGERMGVSASLEQEGYAWGLLVDW